MFYYKTYFVTLHIRYTNVYVYLIDDCHGVACSLYNTDTLKAINIQGFYYFD